MIPSDEHVESAEAAGLRYVTDAVPGIRRKRSGRGFSYVGADGAVIRDKAELERIRKLVIPPRWTDVWICANPSGHLQVTARDARGRKQYRYHPKYRAVRDETKFGRMVAFSEILPLIRERVERDIALPELARDKVLATVVWLLERTLIRVGNDEYARDNGSFGLTTLRRRHVTVSGAKLRFEFRGKSGVAHWWRSPIDASHTSFSAARSSPVRSSFSIWTPRANDSRWTPATSMSTCAA